MTLSYFNQLTEGKKAYFLANFCTLLGSYTDDTNCLVSLYYATNFFVEARFNVNDSSIDSLIAFKSTKHLMPFLEQIKLVELG